MSDLLEQLRAYGRQIEADFGVDAAEGPAPAESGSVVGGSRSVPRSRRSALVLVAAATAAVVFGTSLLLPASPPNGGSTDDSSRFALGTCLSAAACTSPGTGVVGQPSAGTTAPATAQAAPRLFDGSPEIGPGTYGFVLQGVPMEITVPAGWVRHEDFYLTAGPEETSDGFVSFLDVTDVYIDPCNWSAGKAGIGPAVDDLVAGLQAQRHTVTSTPKPLNVAGFAGTELTISIPADVDLSACYLGVYALWTIAVDGPLDRQIDSQPGTSATVWILDVNGKRAVISVGSDDPASTTSAQITEMLGSLKSG